MDAYPTIRYVKACVATSSALPGTAAPSAPGPVENPTNRSARRASAAIARRRRNRTAADPPPPKRWTDRAVRRAWRIVGGRLADRPAA
jgi:hypothetical protein